MVERSTYSSVGRVRDSLVSDVGRADLGLESSEQFGADNRADITRLAGTTGEDDGDGLARRLVGNVISCVGAGTGAASSSSTANGESREARELWEGGDSCRERQENRVCQKHLESECKE